jgi:hypothetical protein
VRSRADAIEPKTRTARRPESTHHLDKICASACLKRFLGKDSGLMDREISTCVSQAPADRLRDFNPCHARKRQIQYCDIGPCLDCRLESPLAVVYLTRRRSNPNAA